MEEPGQQRQQRGDHERLEEHQERRRYQQRHDAGGAPVGDWLGVLGGQGPHLCRRPNRPARSNVASTVRPVLHGRPPQVVLRYDLAQWLPALTLAMGLRLLGVLRLGWLHLPAPPRAVASGPVSAFLLGLPIGIAASPSRCRS